MKTVMPINKICNKKQNNDILAPKPHAVAKADKQEQYVRILIM